MLLSKFALKQICLETMFHLNFIIALFVQIIMIGKNFYRISPCSAAFASLMLAQVHAFMKLFLKFSERKAYKIGFIAEFE